MPARPPAYILLGIPIVRCPTVENTKRFSDGGNVDALKQYVIVIRQHTPGRDTFRHRREDAEQLFLKNGHTLWRNAKDRLVFVTGGGNVVPVLFQTMRRPMPRLTALLAEAQNILAHDRTHLSPIVHASLSNAG
jgi:hypothetical protein